MKVQLVVVRGKPEGRVIPLVGPNFKIGRGETCHLRPISEQISREHAEFLLVDEVVSVRDLGSRNGTLVNGKALTTEPCRLKDRDLVQVGPLTFAVSIADVKEAAVQKPPLPMATKSSPEDVSNAEIDSWLIGEKTAAAADEPTAVYGGDTITISAFKDAAASPKPPASASDDEYERQPNEGAETQDALDEVDEQEDFEEPEENDDEDAEDDDEADEELIDESNPFYAAKKAQEQASKMGPSKPSFKDTSEAAGDILRRLMERRKASRNE